MFGKGRKMIKMNPVGVINSAKAMMKNAVPSFKGKENAVNNKGLTADTVQLSTNKDTKATPETKMLNAVNKILNDDLKLEKGQSVVVKADKTHIPFLKVFAEEA